jgi:hypothetical protein
LGACLSRHCFIPACPSVRGRPLRIPSSRINPCLLAHAAYWFISSIAIIRHVPRKKYSYIHRKIYQHCLRRIFFNSTFRGFASWYKKRKFPHPLGGENITAVSRVFDLLNDLDLSCNKAWTLSKYWWASTPGVPVVDPKPVQARGLINLAGVSMSMLSGARSSHGTGVTCLPCPFRMLEYK